MKWPEGEISASRGRLEAQPGDGVVEPVLDGKFEFSHKVLVATQGYPPLGGGSSTIMKILLDWFEPSSIVLAVEKPLRRDPVAEMSEPHRRYFVRAQLKLPGRIEQERRRLMRFVVRRRLARLARRNDCRAVVGVYPDVFMLDAARGAARDLDIPFVAYLHDTVAEALEGSRLAELGRRVQSEVFESAKSILVVTEGLVDLYREKYGIDATGVVHIYSDDLEPVFSSENVQQSLFWSGNIYSINRNAIVRVFRAASSRGDLRFRVASLQNRELLASMGIQGETVDVTYVPVSARTDYLNMLRSQAVLVLALDWPDESPIHEDELRTIFPTKTPEYLASGRPILCHCPSHYHLAQFLQAHGCAEIVSDPSENAVERGLHRILADPGYAEQLARAGLQASRSFVPERVVPVFHEVVENALDRAR